MLLNQPSSTLKHETEPPGAATISLAVGTGVTTRVVLLTSLTTVSPSGVTEVVVVVVSLVTDVLELELLLSCAQVTTCIKLKRNINKNLPKMPSLTFFMSIGLINKRVDGKLS